MAKKRGKRSNGEGSIFEKPNGKYQAQASYYVNGKRHKKTKTANNYSDAVAYLKKIHEQIENGGFSASSGTLSRYLDSWIETVEREQKYNTFLYYESAIRKYIKPYIGSIKLSDLRAPHIQNFINQLRDNKVGSRTIQKCYVTLRTALGVAVEFSIINENPCLAVKKPKHKSKEIFPLNLDEIKSLLDQLDGHHYYGLCYTALTTGMRIGELCGLFWEQVDFNKKQIAVIQQMNDRTKPPQIDELKTNYSRRDITVSDNTLVVLDNQRKENVSNGFGNTEHVFCNITGDFVYPSSFLHAWNRLLKKAEIKHRGFHHLRHTFATLALKEGVPITVISKTLGHSSPTITLDTYSHVLTSQQGEATNAVSNLVG